MNYSINDGILTIVTGERIDTANATAVNVEFQKILEENPHTSLVIDAEDLKYISSVGLRILLGLRKVEKDMKIINAISEVYEIFEMTGFTEIINVEKAYRKLSVDGCRIIGQGAKGTVYRYDEDIIIKVYNDSVDLFDIKKERELAKSAFVLGIPTAIPYDIVKVGDKFGSVFELLDAQSYSQLIRKDPENFDKYVKEFADLLKLIHSTEIVKDDIPSITVWATKWKNRALPYFSEEDAQKISSLLDNIEDRRTMIHGDYHTNNVMLLNGETILIDMDTLSYGHPIFELANIFMTLVGFGEKDASLIEDFLNLPYDTAKQIWEKFIELYLEGEEESKKEEIKENAKFICYLHLMSHFVHHGDPELDETKEMIQFYKDKIESRLPQIEKLDF